MFLIWTFALFLKLIPDCNIILKAPVSLLASRGIFMPQQSLLPFSSTFQSQLCYVPSNPSGSGSTLGRKPFPTQRVARRRPCQTPGVATDCGGAKGDGKRGGYQPRWSMFECIWCRQAPCIGSLPLKPFGHACLHVGQWVYPAESTTSPQSLPPARCTHLVKVSAMWPSPYLCTVSIRSKHVSNRPCWEDGVSINPG